MKAIRLSSPQQWTVEEITRPDPAEDQVVLEVFACGVCGTDIHTLEGRNPLVEYPVIPGHEFVGTIRAVGADVRTLQVGDRVGVDPSRSCGNCRQCQNGWPNLCPDKGGYGSRFPGGFAEFVAVREQSCVPLPDGMTWDRAILAEPLACVLHGMDRVGPVLGRRALVYGAGPIGMLAALLLETAGAAVHVIEPSTPRRAHAESWGFATGRTVGDVANPDDRWNVVVDATGVPEAIEHALTRVSRAGTVLLLGVAPSEARVELSPFDINWRELTIVGSMAVRHSYRRALELLGTLDDRVESLVSHRIPLTDFARVPEHLREKDAMKVVVGRTSVRSGDIPNPTSASAKGATRGEQQ